VATGIKNLYTGTPLYLENDAVQNKKQQYPIILTNRALTF
jgi:hypothetical protein